MLRRTLCVILLVCTAAIAAAAQDLAPPAPQRVVIHSNILNEDRVIWVRMPNAARQAKGRYAVLYLMDGDSQINEVGGTIDFLTGENRMPPLIVVGIANTDRVRDLTPTHGGMRNDDGTLELSPTSGGGDKFLDFIERELVPEIERRYPTQPYRVFAGHSLGGLMVIHALITRPNLFNAYLAASPSLQWDDAHTLHQAQQFFAKQEELKKTLFFSLANEGNTDNPMGDAFQQLQKTLKAGAPKEFVWNAARYPDEDHSSTLMRAHYDGLRTIFAGWQVPTDLKTGIAGVGLAGVEKHYRELSERFGFPVSSEVAINRLGYALLNRKKVDEAIAAFRRNVELYPNSANVYDSLADGLEAAGQLGAAKQNVEKAVAVATQNGDPLLPEFQRHLQRLSAAGKAAEK